MNRSKNQESALSTLQSLTSYAVDKDGWDGSDATMPPLVREQTNIAKDFQINSTQISDAIRKGIEKAHSRRKQ